MHEALRSRLLKVDGLKAVIQGAMVENEKELIQLQGTAGKLQKQLAKKMEQLAINEVLFVSPFAPHLSRQPPRSPDAGAEMDSLIQFSPILVSLTPWLRHLIHPPALLPSLIYPVLKAPPGAALEPTGAGDGQRPGARAVAA